MALQFLRVIPFPDWISETAISLGPVAIKWYGLSYVVGAMLAYFYAKRTCARDDLWVPNTATSKAVIIPNKQMLEDYLFYCFLGIFIGGRLGFVLLYGGAEYLQDPVKIFKIWEGGMSFHGGFLGVCLAAIFLARKKGLDLRRAADLAAIGAPIGLGLGRLANFANQELYGNITDVPWAFRFMTDPAGHPRHPSQLYEAFLEGFVIFTVLWIASRKFKILTKPGMAAGICVMLYGLFRMFVENFRKPDAEMFGPLTRGMAYSLPMVIIGGAAIIWVARRAPVGPLRPEDVKPDTEDARA